MSQNKLAKLRNTDVFKALMRVLEEYRVPKEDYEVLDRRPHPRLTVRYCGVEREMTIPSTPKTKGNAPVAYAAQLRRLLKDMQMTALGGAPVKTIDHEAEEVHQEVKSVVVAGTVVRRVEYRGQQVVTFAMIDEVHGRPDGTAGRTFRENRDRFVNGQDFFLIAAGESDAMRRFGLHVPNRGLTLITRRGYLKITKSLSDDRAWAVFEEMVDRYFAVEAIASVDHNTVGLSGEVRSIVGGIVKSILHKELEAILAETKDLRSQVSGLLIGADHRVAVLEYVSVAQLLEEGRAIQKGRRSLNQKIGHALQNEVIESGIASNRRRCAHSGKWLFQRDMADAYMRREGSRLVREHNDAQRGQTFMQFEAIAGAAA